jgi:hypothetical protein
MSDGVPGLEEKLENGLLLGHCRSSVLVNDFVPADLGMNPAVHRWLLRPASKPLTPNPGGNSDPRFADDTHGNNRERSPDRLRSTAGELAGCIKHPCLEAPDEISAWSEQCLSRHALLIRVVCLLLLLVGVTAYLASLRHNRPPTQREGASMERAAREHSSRTPSATPAKLQANAKSDLDVSVKHFVLPSVQQHHKSDRPGESAVQLPRAEADKGSPAEQKAEALPEPAGENPERRGGNLDRGEESRNGMIAGGNEEGRELYNIGVGKSEKVAAAVEAGDEDGVGSETETRRGSSRSDFPDEGGRNQARASENRLEEAGALESRRKGAGTGSSKEQSSTERHVRGRGGDRSGSGRVDEITVRRRRDAYSRRPSRGIPIKRMVAPRPHKRRQVHSTSAADHARRAKSGSASEL